jgi:hypothetical protein
MLRVCHVVNFGFTIPTTTLTERGVLVVLGRKGEANMGVTLEAWRLKICCIKNILALARGYVILCSFRFVGCLKTINKERK